jgi:short-subunit dehydrogenase
MTKLSPTSSNKFAVITGASSGIGYELARQFGENGYDILIAAENAEIDSAAKRLLTTGAQVQAVQVDLAREDGVKQLWEAIEASGRPLDAIAINAGVGVGGADFSQSDLGDEVNMIKLNVLSTVQLAKYAVCKMKAQKDGKILFTSSVASQAPGPYTSVYSATKAFIQSFAEAIRYELKEAESGVTVTALLPGATETEFFERADMLNTKVGQDENKSDPADVAEAGFKALMAGDDKVVAGLKNKLQVASTRLMPEKVTAGMQGAGSKPLDKKKAS